eukprot:NODE_2614_length_1535_cov_45.562323_g2254_i0.p1 GENE.NODE_2614_length_1535_cov_45.562323_g2254_i0~~NODE_2614_length_1535_cov_45.562323_g2254_i0.p1  ORF type:complete len:401 (-),score=63.67 NODE_2614_length_1535_cov_45.562323_g2254_i0:235-1437(-)
MPAEEPWGHVFGPILPTLQYYKDVVVGAYIAPDLFENVLSALSPAEALSVRGFSQGLSVMMTEEQKRQFRYVILGIEQGEIESKSVRSGGLIHGDVQLLKAFLLSEVHVATFIDQQLQNPALRSALTKANQEWCNRFPIDPDYETKSIQLANQDGVDSALAPKANKPPIRGNQTPLSTGPGASSGARNRSDSPMPSFSDSNSQTPEAKVMWLQEISWSLKYSKDSYRALLEWRDQCITMLQEFCNTAKQKKSLLISQKAVNSYVLVASNCRARLCLCSPQMSPSMAQSLYAASMADGIEACNKIHQHHKKKAGVIGKFSKPKCELRDIIFAQAQQLYGITVRDEVLNDHVPATLTVNTSRPPTRSLSSNSNSSTSSTPNTTPSKFEIEINLHDELEVDSM